jgi:hypothetical protein
MKRMNRSMAIAVLVLGAIGCGSPVSGKAPAEIDGGPACLVGERVWCPGIDGGGACADLRMDPNNCGACGNVCPAGPANSSPVCSDLMGVSTCGAICNFGYTACHASNNTVSGCQYLHGQGDPDNIQPNDETANPDPNHDGCPSVCVDVANDQNNCGGCNIVCSGTCSYGVCTP